MLKTTRKKKPLAEISKRHLRRIISDKKNELLSSIVHVNPLNLQSGSNYPNAVGSHSQSKSNETNESSSGNEIGNEHSNDVIVINDLILGTTSDPIVKDLSNSNMSGPNSVFINDGYLTCNPTSNHVSILDDVKKMSNQQIGVQFKLELAHWALDNPIPHSHLGELLKILRKYPLGESLPSDPRTILKTPRFTYIVEMNPGRYCHFGIKNGIKDTFIVEGPDFIATTIQLKIGIDGLSLSDSSTNQFWPILGNVIPSKEIFVIGVYHGYSKPVDANQFLNAFVGEMKELINSGIEYAGKTLPVAFNLLICDAPAKAFVQKTKGHNAYFGCSKCIQEGEYIDNRMCYPETSSPKRTDDSFKKLQQEEYHLGVSILSSIPNFGMITNVPLDYMHLVCIGIVKKIITMWIKGPLTVRVKSYHVKKISENLKSLRCYISRKDFARQPQDLHDVGKWKATELRQFILYTCFVALKSVLKPVLFDHVMTLHVALRILVNKSLIDKYLDYAHSLLLHFVKSFEVIYGRKFMSHNVHSLVHLTDDVRLHGTLDSFSAFPFENHLKTLKDSIRKHDKPLQQLHRRYIERKKARAEVFFHSEIKTQFTLKRKHEEGPVFSQMNCIQYVIVEFNDIKLTKEEPDNCCVVYCEEGKRVYIVVKNIVQCALTKQVLLIGSQFLKVSDLYKTPCKSSLVGSVKAENLSSTLNMWALNNDVRKCIKLPWENGYAIISLSH